MGRNSATREPTILAPRDCAQREVTEGNLAKRGALETIALAFKQSYRSRRKPETLRFSWEEMVSRLAEGQSGFAALFSVSRPIWKR
jgi:hypothetical protein